MGLFEKGPLGVVGLARGELGGLLRAVQLDRCARSIGIVDCRSLLIVRSQAYCAQWVILRGVKYIARSGHIARSGIIRCIVRNGQWVKGYCLQSASCWIYQVFSRMAFMGKGKFTRKLY